MNCSAQFPATFEFGCVIQLLRKIKDVPNTGVSMQLVLEALWLAGNMIASIDPVGTSFSSDIKDLDTASDSVFMALESPDRLQTLADKGLKFFDADATSLAIPEDTIQAFNDNRLAKDWKVFIPIILEIIKTLLESRKKTEATSTNDLNPVIGKPGQYKDFSTVHGEVVPPSKEVVLKEDNASLVQRPMTVRHNPGPQTY